MGVRHDILAMSDMIDDIAEAADGFGAEEAIEVLDALEALSGKVRTAMALVKSQAVTLLEQPIQVGSVVYAKKASGKWRPRHQVIKQSLVGWAMVDRATGESFDKETAVQRAVDLTYDAFVAPATMPKKGLLDKLGLDKRDVSEWEHTGTDLVKTDLGEPDA